MGRYSLALRPKYGADEKTRGEYMEQGIGAAIKGVLDYQEAGRQERNTMGAAGATRLPTDPANTPGGRWDAVKRGVGTLLGRGGAAVQPTQPIAGAPSSAMPQSIVPLPPTTVAPPRPRIATSMQEAMSMSQPSPNQGFDSSHPASFDAAPAMTATPTNPAINAPVAAARSGARGIAGALEPYTYEGVHGDRYSVDPAHAERQKIAVAEEAKTRTEEDQIASLVAAGMPAAEARARVLNNVVRYDEQFGQRPRTGGVSQTDWNAREELRQRHRVEIERLHAAGRLTSTQLQQERLKLQQEEAADRRAAAQERAGREDVKGDVTIGNAIETEAQKADRERKERARDARIGSASTAQDRLKNSHASRETVAARARTLQAAGKTREQIAAQLRAEGYRVTP
jgi:hypothetical protein